MINLRPMTPAEFAAYQTHSLEAYAQDKALAAEISIETARLEAAKQIADILPLGLESADHFFYAVSDEDSQNVGDLWLHLNSADGKKRLFIYDIRIFENFRGQGLGSEVLQWIDKRGRELGAASVGLHVFGHNPSALRLYQRHGYAVTNINMRKNL